MALSKIMLAALKMMSYAEIDVSKNYMLDRQMREIVSARSALPYKMWDHLVSANGYDIPVRVFNPPEQRSSEIILYFHGGGWVVGSIDTYTKVCATLSETTGRRVFSVDYRLAPEYPFPYAPEDCYAVTRSLIGLDIGRGDNVILAGDSAGGNLAAVVSLMAADRGEFRVGRQILIYPSTASDHTEASPFRSITENGRDYLLTSKRVCDYISLYLSREEDYGNPYYAPLLAKSLTGQPKTLVITAQYDPLRDEGEAYAARLEAEGCSVTLHRVEDAVHGFFALPKSFDIVREAYEQILLFLS